MKLPVITVRELKAALADKPDDAEVYAWAPGSHMPVASVIGANKGKVLLEINLPPESALSRAIS